MMKVIHGKHLHSRENEHVQCRWWMMRMSQKVMIWISSFLLDYLLPHVPCVPSTRENDLEQRFALKLAWCHSFLTCMLNSHVKWYILRNLQIGKAVSTYCTFGYCDKLHLATMCWNSPISMIPANWQSASFLWNWTTCQVNLQVLRHLKMPTALRSP